MSLFHIHIDADWMSEDLQSYAMNRHGFYQSHFSGSPEGYVAFLPTLHYTLKTTEKSHFMAVWEDMVQVVNEINFQGYLEGEHVPLDIVLPDLPYRTATVPFSITRRRLLPERGEKFRHAEVHLTCHAEDSDPRQVAALLASGLYGGYVDKQRGRYLVLTAQGKVKDVELISQELERFLLTISHGLVDCSIKVERILKYHLVGKGIRELPEVIDELRISEKRESI